MAAKTIEIPVTASTKIEGGEVKTKTVDYKCPKFDEDLTNLIDFVGGSKVLFEQWYERCFKIDKQAAIRRMIDAENGGKPGRSRKGDDVLAKLGL